MESLIFGSPLDQWVVSWNGYTSDLFIMDEQQKRKGKKKWMDFQEDFFMKSFDVLGQEMVT